LTLGPGTGPRPGGWETLMYCIFVREPVLFSLYSHWDTGWTTEELKFASRLGVVPFMFVKTPERQCVPRSLLCNDYRWLFLRG